MFLTQAMNFFAGLFLLFMPEENAFWYVCIVCTLYIEKKNSMTFYSARLHRFLIVFSMYVDCKAALFQCLHCMYVDCHLLLYFRALVGVIDDYFDGYYTEEMIESQVRLNSLILMHALFPSNI